MEAEQLHKDREFVEMLTGERAAPSALLPLDEPRVIAIRDGKHTYTFHFSRIAQPEWERYFERITFKSRNDGKSQVTSIDLDIPGLELFESKLVKAEGYRGEFMTRPNWQAKIPPRHSSQVAWLLRVVNLSDDEPEACDPERIEVRLDALWSQTKPGPDTILYKGLVHYFAPPSAEQKRRFYNAGSQSVVVGGSRNGTTIYGKRHRPLLDIYDELIQDVEGYSIGGRELQAPQEIRREMDAYHKFTAAQHIFSPLAPAIEAEAA